MTGNQIDFTNLDTLNFGKSGGLLPAVVQHAGNDAVLMVGYMNREALVATLTRRRAVFFSRTRGRLWEKGETSGHSLDLVDIRADCDRDALLVRTWPRGPVCHSGDSSCFGDGAEIGSDPVTFLDTLESVIDDRIATRPEGSYTAKLLAAGRSRIAQKVGEEGLEVALAAVRDSDTDVIHESADLLYHLLVLLRARGLKLERVLEELESRHARTAEPSADVPSQNSP
jgi:phosphoribosyl-AMP cyclohydrolase / phosphoribosyl-ATP pyrophosphohydrolase